MSRLWKQVLPRISKVDKPDKRKQTLQSPAQASEASKEPDEAQDDVEAEAPAPSSITVPTVLTEEDLIPADPRWRQMLQQNLKDLDMAVDRAVTPRSRKTDAVSASGGWSQTGSVWYLQSDALQHRPGDSKRGSAAPEPSERRPEGPGTEWTPAAPPAPPSPRAETASPTRPVQMTGSRAEAESPKCKRCELSAMEVNIIAQAFVGFCAKVLSWAHDLSRRKREVLATTVLEYALPCQHLSPEIRFLSEEVKDVQYDGEDHDDNFDALKRHMQQLSEDYARVVEDNHALRQELKGRTEELQQMEKKLNTAREAQSESPRKASRVSVEFESAKVQEDVPEATSTATADEALDLEFDSKSIAVAPEAFVHEMRRALNSQGVPFKSLSKLQLSIILATPKLLQIKGPVHEVKEILAALQPKGIAVMGCEGRVQGTPRPSTSLQSSGASKTQSRADEPWSEVSAVGAVPSKSVPRAAAVPPVRPRRITWPAKGRASISGAKNVVRLLWDGLSPEHILLETFREELLNRFRLLGYPQARLGKVLVQVHAGPEWIMATIQGTEDDLQYFKALPLTSLKIMGCQTQVIDATVPETASGYPPPKPSGDVVLDQAPAAAQAEEAATEAGLEAGDSKPEAAEEAVPVEKPQAEAPCDAPKDVSSALLQKYYAKHAEEAEVIPPEAKPEVPEVPVEAEVKPPEASKAEADTADIADTAADAQQHAKEEAKEEAGEGKEEAKGDGQEEKAGQEETEMPSAQEQAEPESAKETPQESDPDQAVKGEATEAPQEEAKEAEAELTPPAPTETHTEVKEGEQTEESSGNAQKNEQEDVEPKKEEDAANSEDEIHSEMSW